MSNKNLIRNVGLSVCMCLALLFLAPVSTHAASPNIVISQVFGGGGNSGSTWKNDYVELFNRGASPVTITGWSLQYSSKTGTGTISGTNIHTLTGTIQPGEYFLVVESQGTGGTTDVASMSDITPVGPLALSGTDGKIFLANDAVAIALDTTGCPTTSNVVDFVGYGAANCSEGKAPTGVLSSANAAIRKDACVDTDNNASDFSVATAAPRNSATAIHTCAVSTPPSGTGAANPASVDPGSATLLTVTVTPGGNPTSSGITVTGNLQAIGGSQTQQFYDDGTHGDVTAGDNVFSYLATVDAATAPGAKQIGISIGDSVPRTSSATINVTVNQPPVNATPIHTLQGSGDASPFAGQLVTTTGIVTAVTSKGFYLEAPQAEWDSDPATSEGIYVYGGSTGLVAGDSVQVTGTVSEYGSGVLTQTEITSPSVTVNTHSNPLPPVVDIAPVAGGALDQLERYESMRVHIATPQVIAPTAGDGIFYVTAVGVPRPMREAGLEPGAAAITGMPAGVPHFDGNSEKVKVDTSACTVPATVAAGDTVPDITGPLGYSSGDFTAYPECPFTVTNTAQGVVLPDRGANEFTVATFNLLSFTNDPTRMAKASIAIRTNLKSPDLIGVEEMKDLPTLQALATKIQSDGGPSYSAALLGTDGSQNVGVLYRNDRVSVSSTVEVGGGLMMDNTNHTGQTPVFDRAPLVVAAKITPGTATEIPVTLFVNHLKSLISVDTNDASGDFVRRKRQLGAEALAGFLAQHQTAGENVISVGDYNAFEVNDGYVDVMGTIVGKPAGADKVLMASPDLVDPDLTDLATTKPGSYSYVESGNAQTLDHIVVTSGVITRPYHLEVAHINADFPTTYSVDGSRPERVSDHDPVVGYFTLPSVIPAPAVTLSASTLDFGDQVINTTSDPKVITLTNSGTVDLNIAGIVPSAEFGESDNCTATLAAGASCTITVKFAPLTTGAKTGAINITDSASGSPHSVGLTGNGTPVPAPTISLSATSLDFGAQTATTTSSTKTVTITNIGTADLALSNIAKTDANSDFSATNNCPASLAKNASCVITIAFAPKAAGSKAATITITHNATGSPHTVTLAGMGTDVVLGTQTGGSTTSTVKAGSAASYNLQIAGTAGFSGTVNFGCTGQPDKTSCAVAPTSATLSGTTPFNFTVTVTTTAPTTRSAAVFPSTQGPRPGLPFVLVVALFGFGAIVVITRNGKRQFRFAGACAALLTVVALSSCGGKQSTTVSGTQAGTYTLTVTATASGVTRTMPITLIVN